MPRQIDLFSRNLQVTHDPNNQIGVTAAQINHLNDQIPAALAKAEELFLNNVLQAIDQATGLDFVDWLAEAQQFFNSISAALQQSWLSLQNFFNGLAQTADADVTAALAWLQGQFNQLQALLQQSWLSFQNLLNSIIQETDAEVAAVAAYLRTAGEDASAAWTQIQDFITTGDWSDLTTAWNDLMQGIFGSSTSLGLVGSIPAPAVVNTVQNLQPVWDFPDSASVSASGQWSWDGTHDHTGVAGSGSAKYVCNGTLGALRGIPGAVQPSQVVTPSAWVMWSGVTAAGGTSPFQLELIPYSGAGSSLFPGTPVTVASVTSPSSSHAWTELTGTYTVPSSGVTAVQLRLVVTADATAGTVNWDDCQADVSGGFLADMQADTNNIIDSFAPGGTSGQFVTGVENLLALVGLTPASVGGATNLTTLWTYIVTNFINPLNALEISAVNGLASSLSALLGTTTFQNLLDSVANALGHSGTGHTITNIETYLGLIPPANVTNVLGGANLGADVSSVHSTASNASSWSTRLTNDLLITSDVFHLTYQAGSVGDAPGTLGTNGKPTWYSAWNDLLSLAGVVNSTTAPTDAAPAVASAINTAQSTANTGVSNAAAAQSTANTAQSTLNTTNTNLFGSTTPAATITTSAVPSGVPATKIANVLGGANLGADVSSTHTTAVNGAAWATRMINDWQVIGDFFHTTYQLGTSTDAPGFIYTGGGLGNGKMTWWGAWNDYLVLIGLANSTSTPTQAAADVGTAVNTAQSTANTASTNASTAITNAAAAQSTATTANTAAGTAQTTANTANTVIGLAQQQGTNLVLDPGFESAAAWTSASSGTQSTAQAHGGTHSWMLQGAGSGNTTTLRLINGASGPTTLKSRAGEVFQLQSFIYPKTGNVGGGSVKVQIVCTDSTGVNAATTLVAATETVPATGSWSSLSGNAVVPTGYDTVDPQLILLSVPTTDFVYADDVLVRETTLATAAQSSASAANGNANAALSQLASIPQQVVVPNLMAGASSVTFDHAGSGGSASMLAGWVVTPLSCTGTQTIGSTASVMVAAVTFSLVGGSVGNAQVSIGNQQMQSYGNVVQLGSVTEYVEYFVLWNPPVGTNQTVTATAYGLGGTGVGSVSFESASYIGATNASSLSTSSGTGTSLSLSTSAGANTMAVVAFSAGDVTTKANTAISGFTKTQRGNTTVQVSSTQYGYQSLAFGDSVGGSGGVTFGATGADSSAAWVGVGIVLSATQYVGSGFRQSRTSTLTAAPPSGNNTFGPQYDTTQYCTSDISINGTTGVATISIAGHYAVTISQLEAAVTTVHAARPLLYQNGAVVQHGNTMYVTTTASNTWVMQSTFIVYCNVNDTLAPGGWYSTGPGFAITGESTGTQTYWEAALVNRSLM